MEQMIATIMGWGPAWAPRSWSLCNGQLMSIAQNDALFSVIGTIYGGDGINTFALPDLRGRGAIGWGRGPGLSLYEIGDTVGAEQHTLTQAEMPTHNHIAMTGNMRATLPASSETSSSATPGPTMVPATLGGTSDQITGTLYAPATNADTILSPGTISGNITIGNTGGNIPFSITQPVLAISMIIALYGIFPSRS
ncbi:phage tail protein [Rhodospirillum sp. A1_3_36]|uniref:phage tail protein n=1 Tax=Rhodospirillum sp. A1_3_36 TaxID=3391666 RepID=UPI0039A745AD